MNELHFLEEQQVNPLLIQEVEKFRAQYPVAEAARNRVVMTPDSTKLLAMIRQGLGVSILYRLVLEGFEDGLELRPIRERLERPVALLWRNWETMPFAARRFASFVKEACVEHGKPL